MSTHFSKFSGSGRTGEGLCVTANGMNCVRNGLVPDQRHSAKLFFVPIIAIPSASPIPTSPRTRLGNQFLIPASKGIKRRPRVSIHASHGNGNQKGNGNVPQQKTPSAIVRDAVLAGFEPSPELAAILSVYFVQGALGISRLAVSFFLKDNLGLSPAECAALTGAAMLPWLVKPLYGFLSDALPIFGYRRRSYLIGAGAFGAAAWISLATVVDSAFAALVATIATSASVAISDVVVDSIVVQRVRDLPAERSGALQSLCWGTSAVGGVLSAYFSGSLLEHVGPREIFALTAILPLGTTLLAGLISEKRVPFDRMSDFVPIVKQRTKALQSALSNPSVYLPVAFVFAWQATPSPDSAMFFFSTNVLHFGPEFLGRVRLASSAAALFGLWLYRSYLTQLKIKDMFFWATVISVPLSLTQVLLVTRANVALGISDQLFALTDSAVLTALGQVAFMPTLVLAAKLCPPGVEGTLFAALMSVYNASGATSTEIGALLTKALGITETNFDNLWVLITLCSFSGLLALPLLGLIDEAPPSVETADALEILGEESSTVLGAPALATAKRKESAAKAELPDVSD